MGTKRTSDSDSADRRALSENQLEALQHGVAATVMPVSGGWRVHYFSVPDFDDQPGTDFAAFADALQSIADILPTINSPEERERAVEDLRTGSRDSGSDSASKRDS